MRTHLIGAGGIGMSGIAQMLLARGEKVSGSDSTENPLLKKIQAAGGRIYADHHPSHVAGADRVVYSSSIPPQNPELIAARNRGIPVFHRGRMAARLVAGRRTIAVTGAHGKSTTSAMTAELLLQAGLDPTAILGAEVEHLGGNMRLGAGPFAVVEADESDGSLLWLRPFVGVVTNTDEEHLDFFRNRGEILEAYAAFARRVSPEGILIGCSDDLWVRRLFTSSRRRRIFYGLSPSAEISAGGIELKPGGSRYQCLRAGKALGPVRLKVPGIHNVVNSLGGVAVSQALGIPFPVAQAALGQYQGAERRFQIQGEVGGVMVVEDYAHHPAEIHSTLQAARSWPERRIRCLFQPHRYTRTRYLLDRFATCFALADEVILLPIYSASEEPIEGVTSERMREMIQASAKIPVSVQSPPAALERLTADAESGDMILFLGAGSIGRMAPLLVEALRARRSHKKQPEEYAASLHA